jgi:hapalindole-type alkaloid chlorinase
MRQPARETRTALDFYEISLDDLQRFPTAIQDIHHGRYHGIIVRGVFDPDVAAEVSRRVERGQAPIERTVLQGRLARYVGGDTERSTLAREETPGYVLGTPRMTVRMAEGDDDRYLAAAAEFRAGCRVLFEGLPDFEERMTMVLGALAGGRTVQVPPGPAGATYTPATIRVLPKGYKIPIHVENFVRLPAARWLAGHADMTCQLSYFVTLQVPQGGGELIVYALESADLEALQSERDGSSPGYGGAGKVPKFSPHCESLTFKPDPGDLIIFDGTRYFHRVTDIQGARNRITMGGFLLISKDDTTIYYWS